VTKPAVGVFPGTLEHEVGATFKDCESCPEMVVVPAGRFLMGSPRGETGRQANEGPAQGVRFTRPFAVAKFEVTFDDWEACALEGGCNGYRPKDAGWGRGRRPVIYTSWDDAKAYVAWLRGKTGKSYRLLSEAEWEFAARGGTTTAFSTGRAISTTQANFDASNQGARKAKGLYRGKTVEAGTFPANPYGLHEMHGNVAEGVSDCGNTSHAGAPGDGSPRGGKCERRVLKGGSWYYEPSFLRSAARVSYPKKVRLNVVGFRVGRALE
ncbi:MAG: formylglycine-generating enzyme family protein, partial [Methyloligellaceae bacterium]